MPAGARHIADYIETNFDPALCLTVSEAIDLALQSVEPGLSALHRDEIADDLRKQVISRLQARLRAAELIGRQTRFTIEHDAYVRGCDYVPLMERVPRSNLTEFTTAESLSDLTQEEFEELAGPLLTQLGSSIARRTKQSKDGGVDWYARMAIPIRGVRVAELLICVDCKSGSYTVEMLRAFVSAVDAEVKKRLTGKKNSIPEDVDIRGDEPRLLLVVTAREATADARREAGRHGVSILEKSHIARILFPILNKAQPSLAALRGLIRGE